MVGSWCFHHHPKLAAEARLSFPCHLLRVWTRRAAKPRLAARGSGGEHGRERCVECPDPGGQVATTREHGVDHKRPAAEVGEHTNARTLGQLASQERAVLQRAMACLCRQDSQYARCSVVSASGPRRPATPLSTRGEFLLPASAECRHCYATSRAGSPCACLEFGGRARRRSGRRPPRRDPNGHARPHRRSEAR